LDVDTVEEGTQVLVLDDGGLLDAGADLRHFFEVDALKGQVVLLFFLSGDEDTFGGIDSLVDLETQEVLDFEGLAAVEDVDDDREMGVGEDHAELVADGDSGDHVADDASDGTEHCVSLLLLEPHAELEVRPCPFLVFSFRISKGMWLKLLVSLPRGPLTVMVRALTSTLTPSGISSSCSDTMYFIVMVIINYKYYNKYF
jgi:hypothetical protein